MEAGSLPAPALDGAELVESRTTRYELEAHTSKLVSRSYGRRDYYLRRLLALGDALAIVVALLVSLAVTNRQTFASHLLFGVITLPVWVAIFKCYGLYDRDPKRFAHTTIDEIPQVFHAVLLGGVLSWLYFQAAPGTKLTFVTLLLFSALTFMLSLTARTSARTLSARVLAPERVLLVATGRATRTLTDCLRSDSRCKVEIVGRLLAYEDEENDESIQVLGRLNASELRRTLLEQRVGRVVVANSELEQHLFVEVIRVCKSLSVKVSALPVGFTVVGSSIEIEDVRGLTLFGISPPVLSRSSRWAKRGLDIAGAGVGLLLSGPFLLLLAIVVRLDSPGPALFRQKRIGQDGRRFQVLKLRTMAADAESRRAELLAQSKDPGWLHLDHDPRITRVGRFLRHTSLDELPQLWNVLKGDMSLVGPRPLVPEEDEMVDEWARGRLDLTPGLTGLWQVLGRTSIPFDEMVKLDYLYVANWSLWGDIRLMLRTLPVLLTRRGVN